MPLLPDSQIHDILAAAIRVGLARDSLLRGIDPTFVASLPLGTNTASGMLSDLHELNRTGRLADGTIPLRVWLENAQTLASSRVEGQVFSSAIALITSPKKTPQGSVVHDPLENVQQAYGAREHFWVRMSYAAAGLTTYVLTSTLFERGRKDILFTAIGSAIATCGMQVMMWVIDIGASVAMPSLKSDDSPGSSLRVSPDSYAAEMVSTMTFGILSPTLWFHYGWDPGDAGWTAALISSGVNLVVRAAAWAAKRSE